ncbi:hypothetical protein MXB_5345 [Myxobolus squamalis]|nr:hypothetical protein MXB_5345 [Myxobolus squamalis]
MTEGDRSHITYREFRKFINVNQRGDKILLYHESPRAIFKYIGETEDRVDVAVLRLTAGTGGKTHLCRKPSKVVMYTCANNEAYCNRK